MCEGEKQFGPEDDHLLWQQHPAGLFPNSNPLRDCGSGGLIGTGMRKREEGAREEVKAPGGDVQ